MAIFEKRFERKVTLDDTEAITCLVETAQKVDGHTEYVLRIQRGPLKENCWRILRRYNDFAELNKCLQISGIPLPMPGKRVIGNMRPDFIAERRQALQEYINEVLMNPILASSLPAKKFVDPDSYSSSFHDQAVQAASLCLRTEGLFTLGPTLGPIGWRLRKHYFKINQKPPSGQSSNKHLVKSSSQSHQSKHGLPSNGSISGESNSSASNAGNATTSTSGGGQSELVLTWTDYGPDKYVDDKEINGILKSLVGIQHPNIEPILYMASNESGILAIRKFYKQGSLKDILCMSTPKNPFLSKYGNPKGKTTLTMKQIAMYGRQILEAIRFLHSKGMPHGHIHAGNVIIVDDNVKLLDIENFVLGVPAFYRPFFVQHSKIHTAEIIDVYSFGHLLYEISVGYPLQESVVRQVPDCPESLKCLLESILSKEACKVGLPTLDQLIEHKFFKEFAPDLQSSLSHDNPNKYHFKLSTNAKEQLKVAVQKTETRIRDEQKSVKNQKRLVRVQELMSSEEEKKKSKQKARLEHKQSKLKQQNSLQKQNGPPGGPSSPLFRSDSILSVHTSTEAITSPPPVLANPMTFLASPIHQSPPPPPIPGPPLTPKTLPNLSKVSSSVSDETEEDRSALLESICRFNRGSLRKVRSND